VVTNVGHYEDPAHPTGLWLSELTHAWHVFDEAGCEQALVSPAGGAVPLEPRALKFPNYDKTAKAWRADPAKMALLENTASPDEVDPADYDAIYFTGGHAVMYDFPDSDGLQRINREIYERGGIVSSVCHGYCGLLNTTLSDDTYLIAGKKMTGFALQEEILARVDKLVPYNAEKAAEQRGALFQKVRLPFISYTVVDGNLVTGQNPGSAKETAQKDRRAPLSTNHGITPTKARVQRVDGTVSSAPRNWRLAKPTSKSDSPHRGPAGRRRRPDGRCGPTPSRRRQARRRRGRASVHLGPPRPFTGGGATTTAGLLRRSAQANAGLPAPGTQAARW
jgi:putative intracellular protease/amidase